MYRVYSLLLSFFIVLFINNTLNSLLQLDYLSREIRIFTKKGIFQENLSSKSLNVYIVPSEYDLSEDKTYYKDFADNIYPGGIGDICVSKESAIEVPFLSNLISFYIGGHAAISGVGSECIEVTGFSLTREVEYNNKDFFPNLYDEYLAFRVKTSLATRQKAYKAAESFLGQAYNFSFIFNCNKTKYCSDLVSAAYECVGVYFYNNFIATTVLDLYANPYTYMTYYSNKVNGIRTIYILDNL